MLQYNLAYFIDFKRSRHKELDLFFHVAVGVKLTDNGYPESLQNEARLLAVPNVRNLEDWGFVTSYLDNVIRVWDATKGKDTENCFTFKKKINVTLLTSPIALSFFLIRYSANTSPFYCLFMKEPSCIDWAAMQCL